MDRRVEMLGALDRQIVLPESKSVVARVLIINALTHNAVASTNVACCDDTEVMARALASDEDNIYVGVAGTAMRFLTAYFACQQGRMVMLDGTARMCLRPIGPLVDALRQMGANIEYLGSEGYPPLKISGCLLQGGEIRMRGDVSSQFVSAVLMIAPLAGGITLTLEGDTVSRPYIDMTLALMRHFGIETQECVNMGSELASSAMLQTTIVVPAGNYRSAPCYVEGDWSAASYWFALKALQPQSRITLSPLRQNSLQGDSAIVEMMAPLGVKAQFLEDDKVVLSSDKARLVHTYRCDMAETPDLVPTLAVTLCLLRVPFVLTGVATLRLKESDRLEVLRVELAKLGYSLEVGDNGLRYNGNHNEINGEVTLSPHGDHRIAMSLSLAATRHPGITIKDAEVVTKSYPNWWEQLINA